MEGVHLQAPAALHAQVRKAFTADVDRGHTLVVADYGQLELRLLAHMANCKSMLEAFRLGGDFHSRTALNMYEHIKAAVDAGAHTGMRASQRWLTLLPLSMNQGIRIH